MNTPLSAMLKKGGDEIVFRCSNGYNFLIMLLAMQEAKWAQTIKIGNSQRVTKFRGISSLILLPCAVSRTLDSEQYEKSS